MVDIRNDLARAESGNLSESDLKGMIRFWKGRCSTRDFKLLERALRKASAPKEEILPQGPSASKNDIAQLARKIDDVLRPYVRTGHIRMGESFEFYLSGSLVDGISHNPSSPYFNFPSDYRRVSDVDVLVVVSLERFAFIPDEIKVVKPVLHTMPINMDNAHYAGVLGVLCTELRKLSIAGKVGRDVVISIIPKGVRMNAEGNPIVAVAVFNA